MAGKNTEAAFGWYSGTIMERSIVVDDAYFDAAGENLDQPEPDGDTAMLDDRTHRQEMQHRALHPYRKIAQWLRDRVGAALTVSQMNALQEISANMQLKINFVAAFAAHAAEAELGYTLDKEDEKLQGLFERLVIHIVRKSLGEQLTDEYEITIRPED